jgi:hypothetical protein
MKKLLLALLELTAKEIKGKTGTKATVSGVYRSGSEYIALTKKETFPPCLDDWWVLVVSV